MAVVKFKDLVAVADKTSERLRVRLGVRQSVDTGRREVGDKWLVHTNK